MLLLALTATSLNAEESKFRRKFTAYYKGLKFQAQVNLFKKNEEIIPGEIEQLVDEAMAKGVGFEERMYLLDIASAMATMYVYWHKGDKKYLDKVSKFQKKEILKERKRAEKELKERMKFAKDEAFLGNFVMRRHEKEMEEKKLSPVLYPHWIHRIWYECKVCHPAIFTMKRWVNGIAHREMDEGKQCAVCHDGKTTFATNAEGECINCHVAGRPEAERLLSAKKLDHEGIKRVADQLGAEWNLENLPENKLPVDRRGYINWVEMKEKKVFKPIVSLAEKYEEKTRDNQILYISKSGSIKNVLFSHNVHSEWIGCSSCHPMIFKETLTNHIMMRDMSSGLNCGYCHGKVSFSFSNCKRCHNIPKDQMVEGALQHVGVERKKARRRERSVSDSGLMLR